MSRVDLLAGVAIGHRNRALVIATAVMTLVAIVVPVTELPRWVGWLPTSVSEAKTAVVWMPSVVCLVAAWLAGQPIAHGYEAWASTSSRAMTRRVSASYIAAAACMILGQVLQLAGIGIVSAAYGMSVTGSQLVLLLELPTMTAYLLTWVGIGVWLGRTVRREIALPLCAVLPYVAYAATIYMSPTSALSAVALGDGRVYDYIRPGTDLLAVRGVLWSAAAVLAAACAIGLRRTRTVAAWLTSAALAATVFIGPSFGDIPGAAATACNGATPTVCLDGSHASALPRYRNAVLRLLPALPSPLRPDVVTSSTSLVPAQVNGTVLVAPPLAGTTSPGRLVDQVQFTALFGDAVFVQPCSVTSSGVTSALSLALWWRIEHGLTLGAAAYVGDGLARAGASDFDRELMVARAFAARPATDRAIWFERHAAAVRSCSAPDLLVS